MEQPSHRRWGALASICVSLLVIALDNTIMNVALPTIARDLNAGVSELQWIVDAYVLAFAALLLTMGSLGDRMGRKKALQVGLVLFGSGSVAAGLSRSTGMLIAMRAFMGIGAAVIMPATLSLLTATFRDARERARAIAIWTAMYGLGVGLGPVIGGRLLQSFSWPSVFFVNVPVVILAIVGDQLFVDESKDERAQRPDIPGVVLSIGGLFALVYAIIKAGTDGWGATHVIVAFCAAAVLLAVFAWWERRTDHPMVPLGFFKNLSFSGANFVMVLIMFCLFGAIFFMSQFFQSVQGYSAFESGLRLLPMSLVVTVAAALSARFAESVGIKISVGGGLVIAAAGMFFMSYEAAVDVSYAIVLIGMCATGIGLGLAMSPATNSVMGAVPVRRSGVGSAMNDTTRQIGGALGVAVMGSIMNQLYLSRMNVVLDVNGPDFKKLPVAAARTLKIAMTPRVVSTIKSGIQGAHAVAARIPVPQIAKVLHDTSSQAFVVGMARALFVAAFVMCAASFSAFVMIPSQIRRPIEEEVEAGRSQLDTTETRSL